MQVMNDRQKRITRIISPQEYRTRRYAHDLPKPQALKIATRDVIKAYDIDSVLDKLGQYVDEKR